MQYTAGELAKKLGVTARTVRFYDEKKLLIPCDYSESGYRLYNDDSALRLQKILMLKFMDFSLEQICEIMKEDAATDIRESLKEQELMLIEKKEHIERIIDAVRKTKNSSDNELWENMRHIIEMTKDREYVIKQYMKDDNLNKRISIHEYSTAKESLAKWMFDRLELAPGMKVLDIGCGTASFWQNVAPQLPEGLEIHLTDYSEGMLESAGRTVREIMEDYPEKKLKFVVDKRDATKFDYPVSGFDRIMANHMLYHIAKESRLQLYRKINELLLPEGRFSCSLIGRSHMKELHDFVNEYYPEIAVPSSFFDIWLENASEELADYFNISLVEEQKNDLLVPDEELVYEYVSSYSKSAAELIGADKELFLERVRDRMDADGYMFIHKSTGMIVCDSLEMIG